MQNKQLLNTRNMVIIAMMTALATVAYYVLEIPIIPFQPHLKVNFADVPALLCGMVVSPAAGVVVVILRCVLHLFKTSTAGIGEAVDVVIGLFMLLPFFYVHKKAANRVSQKTAYLLACIVTVLMTIIGGVLANLLFYPIFMTYVIRVPIESAAVFIAYLSSTILTNVVRSVATLVVCIPFLPLVKKMRAQLFARG